MVSNMTPPSGVNNKDLDKPVEYDGDPELTELFRVPQPKRTRRTANEAAGIEHMTTTPNNTARRPSEMSNTGLGKADDSARNLGRGIASKVSPLKRKRGAVDPSGRGETSTPMPDNMPDIVGNDYAEFVQPFNSDTELTSQQRRGTQLVSSNIQAPQQAAQQPQQVALLAQTTSSTPLKHKPRENKQFPPSDQALPASLTLQEICRDYPNHLNQGPILRRFLTAGWTGKKMWNNLQDSAKVSRSTKRGWNKFEQRLNRERRLMADDEEEEEVDPIEQGPQDSSSPQVSMNAAGPAFVGSNHRNIELETRAQAVTSTSAASYDYGSTHRGRSEEDQASLSVQNRLETVQKQIRAEVKLHGSIFLTLMSYEDPRWLSLSKEERVRRAEGEWLRRTMRLEKVFMLNHGIDDEDLEIPRTSALEMMRRLHLLVKRASQPMSSSAATTELEQAALFHDETRLVTYQQQLEILQGWTAQWQEEIQRRARGAIGVANAQMSRPRVSSTYSYLQDQLGYSNPGSTTAAPHMPGQYPMTNESSLQGQSHLGFPGFGASRGYANTGYGSTSNPQGYYQQPWGSTYGQPYINPYLSQPPPGLLAAANLEANAGSADRSGPQVHQLASAYPPMEELVNTAAEPRREFSNEQSVGPAAPWNVDDLLNMDEDLYEE